jgi:hypothetical protein
MEFERNTHVFIVRITLEPAEDGPGEWRGRVTPVGEEEKPFFFRSLDDLIDFIVTRTGAHAMRGPRTETDSRGEISA